MNKPDNAVERLSRCDKCGFHGVTDRFGAHATPLGDRCHYAASKPIATAAGTAFPAAARPTPPSAWSNEAGAVERCVMVCPQCEGEGGYADGLDEAACHTDCTRCGTNGWIVDLAATAREGWPADRARADAAEAREKALREALEPFALVAEEYDRWQAKGSLTPEEAVRFGYGRARLAMPEFRAARAALGERS